MKKFRVAHLIIAIAWFALGASALRTMHIRHLRMNLFSDFDGISVYSMVGGQEVSLDHSAIPNVRWSSTLANPPLSPRLAAKIASDFFERNAAYGSDGHWGIEAIRLAPINSRNESWLWAVSIQVPGEDDYGLLDPVYVSMAGAVLNPRSAPEIEPTPTIDEPDIFEIYGEKRSDPK